MLPAFGRILVLDQDLDLIGAQGAVIRRRGLLEAQGVLLPAVPAVFLGHEIPGKIRDPSAGYP